MEKKINRYCAREKYWKTRENKNDFYRSRRRNSIIGDSERQLEKLLFKSLAIDTT